MSKNPFQVLSSREVYRNPWIAVQEDQVTRPDGKEGIFGTILIKPGAIICAVDREAHVFLIRGYRYAIQRNVIELPGGGIEPGQTPLQCAQRELLEETGLIAQRWIEMPQYYSFGTYLRTDVHSFIALDATFADERPEDDDDLVLERMPYFQAKAMVLQGEISHVYTSLIILQAEAYLREAGLLPAS